MNHTKKMGVQLFVTYQTLINGDRIDDSGTLE